MDTDVSGAFLEHIEKIKQLKVTDVKELNRLIDEISSSSHICFDSQVIENLLIDICTILPLDNDHILSKFSCLIYYFAHKRKIMFSTGCLKSLVKYLLTKVFSCGTWVLSDVLVALSALLYENAGRLEEFHLSLIGTNGILINLTTVKKHDQGIQYSAFLCLQSLLLRKQGDIYLSDDLLGNCCQNCISILKEDQEDVMDILAIKIIICSLKCLQFIFTSKNVPVKSLGELLGTLKHILFYGLPGKTSMNDRYLYPTLACPNTLETQNDSQSESNATSHSKLRKQKNGRRSRVKKKPKNKCEDVPVGSEDDSDSKCNGATTLTPPSLPSPKSFHNNWTKSSSSDSEFSDAESHLSKVKSHQASTRQHAYQALQAVVKTTDKKLMFGYWSSFLPDYPATPGTIYGHNIFTTILKDPSPQVRLSALALFAEMLRGSKQFLAFADGRNTGNTSFTSLSSILASMISEFHRCLLLALLSENSASLLIQILKCYAILLECVPYKRLSKDILSKLLKQVKPFLLHKDSQVQVACLTVFGSLVRSDQLTEDITDLVLSSELDFIKNEAPCSVSNNPNLSQNNLPWIVYLCKRNIFNEGPLPVRLESLQLLSSIVGKYFNKLQCFISLLEEIILFCLNDPDPSLQLHGAKLLEVLGRCVMNDQILSQVAGDETKVPPNSNLQLWQNILSSSLISCLTNDSQKTLQSVCCDCLSTIPPNVFEHLDGQTHLHCITLLLGLASDPDPNVRGAAIRCLGVYSLFPCLTQDISFLSDVSEILIKAVKDSNLNVRFKASWSLGNLSDALFLNRDELYFDREVPIAFFCATGMACVHFSTDCDRIRANAVRALGNFLRYLPEKFLGNILVQDFIKQASSSLKFALTANVMKVCWNSCYALGNMFKNASLIKSELLNVEDLLGCLINVLKSPNFKVRISATQALTLLSTRGYYGTVFPRIWLQLVASLYSVAADVNFKEIKHQENLCDQICYSICQMATLITYEDFDIIAKDTLEASEILLTSMWKFGFRTIEDKILVVCLANDYVSSLIDAHNNSEILQPLGLLQDILTQARIAFYQQG